jgi:hypothetical protein
MTHVNINLDKIDTLSMMGRQISDLCGDLICIKVEHLQIFALQKFSHSFP